MKFTIKTLLLLFVGLLWDVSSAQTHRFYYKLAFKPQSADTIYWKDIIVTEINAGTVKSYSADFIKLDSINRVNNSLYYANPKFEDRFIKDLKTGRTVNYLNILENYYGYLTEDEMNWTLLQEFKKIGEFNVQKGETNFGGRKWIAWFAPDLPFPYGPYKFYGLPGMILEAHDVQNNYVFDFYKNENLLKEYDTTEFLETYYGEKPIVTAFSKIIKVKTDFYLDPYRAVKMDQVDARIQDGHGNTVAHPNYDQLTKEVRADILKYNNPLDLTQKINYPKKE